MINKKKRTQPLEFVDKSENIIQKWKNGKKAKESEKESQTK